MNTQSSEEHQLEDVPENAPEVAGTVDERLDALTMAIKSFAEAYEVIVEDLANVEAILFNLEIAFGEAFEGRDVAAYIARIRQRLAMLQIFQPDASPAATGGKPDGG